MPEEMAPQQPTWRLEPKPFDLPVEKIVEGPYPEEEVAISFKSNGETKSAIVPSTSVDRDRKIVKSLVVGEAGAFSLVALRLFTNFLLVQKNSGQALSARPKNRSRPCSGKLIKSLLFLLTNKQCVLADQQSLGLASGILKLHNSLAYHCLLWADTMLVENNLKHE